MKKNYNYAYSNLRESWNSSIRTLNEYGFAADAQDLGELDFTHACLEKLVNKIEQFGEAVIDEPESKYDEEENQESQMLEYQTFPILNKGDEQETNSYELQRKVICITLTKTQQDFEFLYNDVKAELTDICSKGKADDFRGFLLENPWSSRVLVEIGFRLSMKALELKNYGILSLLFENDSNIPKYKVDLLKASLSQNDLNTVEFLLERDKYSVEEVRCILGTTEYYSSSEGIVDKLTEFLSGSSQQLIAIDYKAMFLYSHKQYEEAIALFNQVESEGENREKQMAQFYKGLCLQYSRNSDGAIEVFRSIIEGSIDEYYDNTSSIKDHAQKHLDSLDNIVGKKAKTATLKTHWESIDNVYLKSHVESLKGLFQGIKEHMDSPQELTAYTKEIISTLSRIKFIALKQKAPMEIVAAQEFSDLQDLYSHMTENINAEELNAYNSAVEEIDGTILLIGDITYGLTIEDVF